MDTKTRISLLPALLFPGNSRRPMGRRARTLAGRVAAVLLLVWLPGATVADGGILAANHPQEYTVVRGDTLWDISGRFLAEPWRWPEIWDHNPQIRNPHLIYPGDVISLVYRDGKPALRLRRGGRPVVKWSPSVRSSRRDGAIPTIPLDAIRQFLSDSRIVTDDDVLDSAPYVVSVGKEHLLGGTDGKVYVRNFQHDPERQYSVFRRGQAYRDPDIAGEDGILGREALFVADVVLERAGDPATLVVTRSRREVLAGDRLLAADHGEFMEPFLPRAPDTQMSGSILAVVDGVTQIGRYQIVVLDLGREEGIEPGHVLAVYQKGATVSDRFAPDPGKRPPIPEDEHSPARDVGRMLDLMGDALGSLAPKPLPEVDLPDERAGLVMVFRSFERMSYALVMDSSRAMHVEDRVLNP